MTYPQLADFVVQYASALKELAIAPGMLVGIECQDRLSHLVWMWACANIGATTISLLLRELQPDDPFLRRCDFVLTHGATNIPAGKPGLVVTPEWMRGVAQRPVPDWDVLDVAADPRSIARIVRTSGTSGQAKALALTHGFIDDVVAQYGAHPGEAIPPAPRFIVPYALSAQFACNRVAMCIRMGGTAILGTHASFITDIERYDANYAMLLTGDAEKLVSQLPASFRKPPVFGLATVGAGLSARLRATLLDRLASHVVDIYATNETGRICVAGADGVGDIHAGLQVAIRDEHGRNQPYGKPGLIAVRSDTMVDGYLDDPELTQDTFVDGWFRSSDIGVMPAPDRLMVLGRADDMLNVGGLKIAPGPIEDEVKAVPGVRDAAIVAVAGKLGTATPAVAVEADARADAGQLKAAITNVVRQRFERFHVMIADALPRTQTGKIRRRDVESMFRRRLGLDA